MESVDDGRRFVTASSLYTETKHRVALKVGRGNFGIDARIILKQKSIDT